MKSLVLALLLIISIGKFSAQTTEGQITYKMDFSSDNPEMAVALPMMQGSTMQLYFTKDKSAANVEMGSIMKMKSVMDTKLDKGIILIDVMGQQIANNIESISKTKVDTDKIGKPVLTSETKQILGFNCKKYTVKDPSGEGNDSVLWITTDIKTTLAGQKQFTNGLEGVPLEFSTMQQGMNVHFEATNFVKTLDHEVFSTKIPEGYKIMTEEEMKRIGA